MAERVEFKSGKSIQLNLPQASTVIVMNPREGQPVQPLKRIAPEDRYIHPLAIEALMQDFLDFGKADMDTLGNETKLRRELVQLRDSVDIEDLKEDIETAFYEANIEGRKWKSKPQKLQAFRKIVDTIVDDIYTEPRPQTQKAS